MYAVSVRGLKILQKIITADRAEKLVQVLVIFIEKRYGFLSALAFYAYLSAEMRLYAKLHFAIVIYVRQLLFLFFLYRLVDSLNLFFKLSDREIKLGRFLRKKNHIVAQLNTEQRSAVSCGNLARSYHIKNGRGKVEQSYGICNCTAALSYFGGKLLLSQAVFFGKRLECHSLFYRVEVFSLKVLNQRDTENFIQLKDILSSILSHNLGNSTSTENNGDTTFDIDINVESIGNDYDVDKVASRVKALITEDARYRNNNAVSLKR